MSIHKTVYFVRHGESEANVTPIFQPPTSPLTEKGRAQAQAIAARASRLQFDALIASPFLRAKETAEAIAQATGKVIEFSELFVERIKPSSINGKPYTDKEADATWRRWEETLYTIGQKVEDGESLDDLIARADRALALLRDRPEQTLLVVSHGFFLRTLIARVIMGEALNGAVHKRFQSRMVTRNTAITVIRYDDNEFESPPAWRLVVYNDHAHLG